jgi:hypothetical protein
VSLVMLQLFSLTSYCCPKNWLTFGLGNLCANGVCCGVCGVSDGALKCVMFGAAVVIHFCAVLNVKLWLVARPSPI